MKREEKKTKLLSYMLFCHGNVMMDVCVCLYTELYIKPINFQI